MSDINHSILTAQACLRYADNCERDARKHPPEMRDDIGRAVAAVRESANKYMAAVLAVKTIPGLTQ